MKDAKPFFFGLLFFVEPFGVPDDDTDASPCDLYLFRFKRFEFDKSDCGGDMEEWLVVFDIGIIDFVFLIWDEP